MDRPVAISVIIATFNRSGYLRQAIASVLAQTYPDLEPIVVDDGSSDDTAAVVAGFADPRIRYIYQANQGRSAARNRGLAEARGRYIAFLDDDDLYLPHKLALQVQRLDSDPTLGLVAGGARIVDADGALLRTWRTWEDQPHLTLPACLYALPLLTCAVLFRREWLARLAHWFDPEMDRAEDTDFWLRLLIAGCKMDWTPDIVCAYRQHPANSQQDSERYYHGYLRLLDKLYAEPDLPESLLAERGRAYAHYHVIGAYSAYRAGEIGAGQARLLQAAAAAPEAMEGNPPAIACSIVGAVQSDSVVDPTTAVDALFRHLPPTLARLRVYRGYVLSALPMQRVFAAHTANQRPEFADWLQGVSCYPRWLLNRGVWSILLRDVLLTPLQQEAQVSRR